MNNKICPPGKILNPKTNRCVNIDGVIGKQILQTSQPQQQQQEKSPRLKNVLNDIDIGPIIKKNLKLEDALALYNSKKHKDFMTVEKVPKVFMPFLDDYDGMAQWVISITKPSFIITFGTSVEPYNDNNYSRKPFKYLVVLVKHGNTYDRLYIDLINKETDFDEFYTDQADIENGKKRVQELVKDIFTKIESSESVNIINLSMIKPINESSHKYMMLDEFESKLPPKNIKIKFNKFNKSYYYKFGGIKAEIVRYYSGNKLAKFVCNIKLELTIPKKEIYIEVHKNSGVIHNYYEDHDEEYNITKEELNLYWSQAYNVFTKFLSDLTLDTKKMSTRRNTFKKYASTGVEEYFKNLTITKYPAFIYGQPLSV